MGGGREKNRKSREGSFPEDLSEGGKGLSGEEKDGPVLLPLPGGAHSSCKDGPASVRWSSGGEGWGGNLASRTLVGHCKF